MPNMRWAITTYLRDFGLDLPTAVDKNQKQSVTSNGFTLWSHPSMAMESVKEETTSNQLQSSF